MKIVMITSEALPFTKVGGLADVVYSLSKKMVLNKVNISIVLPLYKSIKKSDLFSSKGEFVTSLDVNMSWRKLKVDVYRLILNHVNYYFVGNDYYFDRDEIYGEKDDFERFAFYTMSCYQIIENIIKKVDIIHLHDWQGSALPLIYHHNNPKSKVRFMLTIHNPAFQGLCDRFDLWNYFSIPEYYFDNGLARLGDKVSLLKSAVMLSDIVTTVSPNHKEELKNGISSYGLEHVLHYKNSDFVGIINGLDNKEFNPMTDNLIYKNFNKDNFFLGKKINKQELCKELDLPFDDKPLFCVVSRLTSQKGINFLINNIENILKLDLNLVILGRGEKEFENQLTFYCHNKKNAKCLLKYSNELAHKIYASSDFLLMPSVYEPCGIAQMIAMRYGTLPIASKTGGLYDTITSYNGLNVHDANGLLFGLDNENLMINILMAINIYEKKRILSKLIHNAMSMNFSWTKSCEQYLRLYRQILQKNKSSN